MSLDRTFPDYSRLYYVFSWSYFYTNIVIKSCAIYNMTVDKYTVLFNDNVNINYKIFLN